MSSLENSLTQCIKEALLPEIKTLIHQAVKEALDNHPSITGVVEEEFFTAEEAAAYVKEKLPNFRKRLMRGEIPRLGPDGKVYCKKSDLVAFMSQQPAKTKQQLEAEANDALSVQFCRKRKAVQKGASQQGTSQKSLKRKTIPRKAA